MDAHIALAHKQLIAQQQKSLKKNGVELGEIDIIEIAILDMEIKAKALSNQIDKEEGSYTEVAKNKLERKLKKGVDAKMALKHQSSVDLTKRKLEIVLDKTKSKIEKLEATKDALESTIKLKIERLQKKLEDDINGLERDLEKNKKEIDDKINELEKEKERDESKAEGTVEYYQQLVDKCYEDVPLDVAFPPSHFKKKEELKNLLISIQSQKNLVLVMKAANYDAGPKVNDVEEQLKKAREQAIKEDLALQQEIRKKEEEQEMAAYLARKQAWEQEEKRVEARRLERVKEQEIIKIPNSTIQIYSSYNVSGYDNEGEPLTKEQIEAEQLALERDYAEPLVYPPPPSSRKRK